MGFFAKKIPGGSRVPAGDMEEGVIYLIYINSSLLMGLYYHPIMNQS
jgi:hypothetical protein